MRNLRYLLIGGGLASVRAARQIRRMDAEGSLLIACDEPVPPYDRPPLSKEYLRGEKAGEALVLERPSWLAEQRIDLALGQPVSRLDASRKVARLADGEDVAFERALIATGGRPVRLRLPGAQLPGVHYLRTLADADAIAAAAQPGRRAVVVGGGFIGMEVAATLRQRGLEVTVVEALPRIWARFASEVLAEHVSAYCRQRGVRILTNRAVGEFRGTGRVEAVVTTADDVLGCDLVCVGVGIVPNVELAAEAGLAVDNGIVVDEQLRTSVPDIYAAGDVINYFDPIAGTRRRVEHWGHAEYSGQVAGQNMAGAGGAYTFLSYVWSDIFDLHLEFAGDERQADAVVLRGAPEDGAFVVLHLQAGRLVAFFALNTPAREFAALRRLIQARTEVRGRLAELQDPAFSLRSLV